MAPYGNVCICIALHSIRYYSSLGTFYNGATALSIMTLSVVTLIRNSTQHYGRSLLWYVVHSGCHKTPSVLSVDMLGVVATFTFFYQQDLNYRLLSNVILIENYLSFEIAMAIGSDKFLLFICLCKQHLKKA